MGFEKFTLTRRSHLPKVSIWSRGQVGFSTGAVNRFNLGKYTHVIFLYDKDNQKVGFQFTTNEKEEGTAKLNQRTTGAIVGAKAFLDFYAIDYTVTKQYTLEFDEENNLYVIDLQEGEKSAIGK